MSMKVCPCTRGKYDPETESMCGQCEREWTDKWGNIPRQNPSRPKRSGPPARGNEPRGYGVIDPRRR